jgi:DNA invertase Pin-like site-specific DNA recombinase
MAEFERSLIEERVRAGLRNARAKGKKFGRPKLVVVMRDNEFECRFAPRAVL